MHADTAATANARRLRKEDAVRRRLNKREEDARNGPVYGAGLASCSAARYCGSEQEGMVC